MKAGGEYPSLALPKLLRNLGRERIGPVDIMRMC